MIELSLAEIAAVVGGRLHRADGTEKVVGAVEFDSRKVTPGGLFVAVPGERVDGHDFAAAAVAAGAAGVLAGREVDAPSVIVPPVAAGSDRSYVLAGDRDGSGAAVLAALAALARHVVDRLTASGLAVVGVTGSSGKTSTKDLIARLLAPLGPTVAPPGSFNNELGHPWTALRADEHTRHLVLELSARGVGHVAALCRTAPPRIGAVLNIGSAHLGEFGSREAIAQAKGELVEALPSAEAGGVAVLNADDPLVSAMAARTSARVVRFGQSADADVRAEDVELDELGRPGFELVTPVGRTRVRLGLHGEHQVGNALAAVAVALELGADLERVAEELAAARPASRWRMEVTERPDGVVVVNDAYNANPESVRAALKTLVAMARGRRSWAVLGPMAELGERSAAEHDEIGRLAVRFNVSRLVVVGEQARPMHQGACWEGSWGEESVLVPDVEAAVALLRAELRPGDVVLVKASRAAGLERVARDLLAGTEGAE
ncbi:UDP-N-acetylmuramoyl-tripeptide--D-alanyl-D-alanine ligase [Streptoalloteichus tenebrarius]|uniref:UDP-N-acetylmuramoyl-tripeptide--D-alanyl-D-alanine ligase n=1 Tax=Streptoalloteichus tenebrarius (strain ATCC 17920 / DSM 40477 / JCM 4838 / CBS 697.72 / NBRC 16177 / NCIMB 11028 / NRRL B-12390 / A12253. 1 / ISP 5477) TaxID=1933 RepID=A0ABT1HN76_STRSD|nr:UDP-N-acetylmuramoyl-tripeptide--D-alanyl-D-alanine ligase [Streptoalloteichus tenebrarius]MCP2256961.1 UDP-N-acetylmuramoyl-tripeptide--D-alanyl-D-alanine ligase [Streptoalloteichus tenebrarius]BFF00128.1 UDP-N-acetylmuramoyl-tripeptide--D-alanyl-D-alanine ligase [Streptoalloteichus tenebrarius]